MSDPPDPPRRRFLTADEAAAALGVQRATLYAYVSRGLLRSEAGAQGRVRLYPAADVEALQRRTEGRRDPPAVARAALAWGAPVLDSALTLIAGGRLWYRGRDAVALARQGETLERIAALLWLGSLDAPLADDAGGSGWPAPSGSVGAGWDIWTAELPTVATRAAAWRPFQRIQALLPILTTDDPAAYDLRPTSVIVTGARLLQLVARLAAGPHGRPPSSRPSRPSRPSRSPRPLRSPRPSRHASRLPGGAPPGEHAASILVRGWAPAAGATRRAHMERLLDAVLVLSADHELNVSAFTARCVASARAPLAAVVLGALAALGGHRHGAHSDRVEALFVEVAPAPRDAAAARRGRAAIPGARRGRPATADGALRGGLADRLRRGEDIPGFGHPLYPEGDPRARLLLDLLAAGMPESPEMESALALADAAWGLLGERPSLDFALVAVARALGLPAGAPLGLFAVGRTAGWIAHALEQYADPRLIRPRARYAGPPPA